MAPAGAPDSDADSLPDDLVVLATFGDAVEASILQGRLEQAGIEACVPEELGSSAFSNLPLSAVTVRVAQKDLAAARAILGGAPDPTPNP